MGVQLKTRVKNPATQNRAIMAFKIWHADLNVVDTPNTRT